MSGKNGSGGEGKGAGGGGGDTRAASSVTVVRGGSGGASKGNDSAGGAGGGARHFSLTSDSPARVLAFTGAGAVEEGDVSETAAASGTLEGMEPVVAENSGVGAAVFAASSEGSLAGTASACMPTPTDDAGGTLSNLLGLSTDESVAAMSEESSGGAAGPCWARGVDEALDECSAASGGGVGGELVGRVSAVGEGGRH